MNVTSLKLLCVIQLRSAEDPSVVAIPWSHPDEVRPMADTHHGPTLGRRLGRRRCPMTVTWIGSITTSCNNFAASACILGCGGCDLPQPAVMVVTLRTHS